MLTVVRSKKELAISLSAKLPKYFVSRAKVIPHPRGRGNSPLLPEMVVCYCRVLGLNFFL